MDKPDQTPGTKRVTSSDLELVVEEEDSTLALSLEAAAALAEIIRNYAEHHDLFRNQRVAPEKS